MADINTPDSDAIAACKSVMMEVLTILGKHRKYLVIVGGWVPPLLFGDGDHIGSLDVDLAIDWRRVPPYAYETINNELSNHGYYRNANDPPNRFRRNVDQSGQSFAVQVDLITATDEGDAESSHRVIQGMQTWCARGVRTALDSNIECEIAGILPEGGRNHVSVRVATAAALLVMKGMALHERMKEKDAYDIYYCCRHHPQGIEGLAAELRPLLDNREVREALEHIREKFSHIDSIGPVWAAQIIEQTGGDYDSARRDAFERAQALLFALAIIG